MRLFTALSIFLAFAVPKVATAQDEAPEAPQKYRAVQQTQAPPRQNADAARAPHFSPPAPPAPAPRTFVNQTNPRVTDFDSPRMPGSATPFAGRPRFGDFSPRVNLPTGNQPDATARERFPRHFPPTANPAQPDPNVFGANRFANPNGDRRNRTRMDGDGQIPPTTAGPSNEGTLNGRDFGRVNRDGRNRDWRNRDRQTGTWAGENSCPTYRDAMNRYRHECHNRDWWRSHCNRIILVSGGYYYWNTGYWYPAWGYDSYYSNYAYDGPIYGYDGLPPDQIIASVQSALQEEGYYFGAVDGVLGPLTRQAIAAYQRDHGLAITTVVDAPTLRALGLS